MFSENRGVLVAMTTTLLLLLLVGGGNHVAAQGEILLQIFPVNFQLS